MPKASSQIDGMLDRISRVAQQAAERLKKELRHIQTERENITTKLDHASEQIRAMLSGPGMRVASANGQRTASKFPRTAGKRKRIRRSPQQLKEEAESMLQFIKSKGAEGMKGAEIRKHFPKVGPDIKGFVQKFGGRKLKTTGKKAAMRYVNG